MKVTLENQLNGLCVVCSTPITATSFVICKGCNQLSQIDFSPIKSSTPAFYDLKTVCCHTDFIHHNKTTCSDSCHQVLVDHMQKALGQYVRIEHPVTKVAHKVPTKFIIEHGCDADEISTFPRWK